MKTLQKGIAVFLLILIGAANALAGPQGRGPEGSDAQRGSRGQYAMPRYEPPQAAPQPQPAPGPEGQGRQGRMSPEERRTLRQQINEANQNIPPRRR